MNAGSARFIVLLENANYAAAVKTKSNENHWHGIVAFKILKKGKKLRYK